MEYVTSDLYPFKILSFGPEGLMRERSVMLLVSTRYFTAGEREIVSLTATDAVEYHLSLLTPSSCHVEGACAVELSPRKEW